MGRARERNGGKEFVSHEGAKPRRRQKQEGCNALVAVIRNFTPLRLRARFLPVSRWFLLINLGFVRYLGNVKQFKTPDYETIYHLMLSGFPCCGCRAGAVDVWHDEQARAITQMGDAERNRCAVECYLIGRGAHDVS